MIADETASNISFCCCCCRIQKINSLGHTGEKQVRKNTVVVFTREWKMGKENKVEAQIHTHAHARTHTLTHTCVVLYGEDGVSGEKEHTDAVRSRFAKRLIETSPERCVRTENSLENGCWGRKGKTSRGRWDSSLTTTTHWPPRPYTHSTQSLYRRAKHSTAQLSAWVVGNNAHCLWKRGRHLPSLGEKYGSAHQSIFRVSSASLSLDFFFPCKPQGEKKKHTHTQVTFTRGGGVTWWDLNIN